MNSSTNSTDSHLTRKLQLSLLLLRIGVAVVMAMWTIDKFVNPEHAAAVFKKFYMIDSLTSTLAYGVGALQAVVVIAFIAGAFRNVSYLIVLVLHSISTFSSYAKYIDPWTYPNLLFFAAIPMLSACFALWLLRNYDNLLSVDGARRGPPNSDAITT